MYVFFFFQLFFVSLLITTTFSNILGVMGVFIILLVSFFFFFITIIYYVNFFWNGVKFVLDFKLFKSISNIDLYFSYRLDFLSYSFLLLIVSIGFFVFLYSFSYFKFEVEAGKFLNLLCWFIVAICLLVGSNSVFSLILGWELIGVTSFFLINFWHLKVSVIKSALKSYFFNKVSDFFLLIFLIKFIIIFNTGDFFILYNDSVVFLELGGVKCLGLVIVVAASLKTTQIFFHIWLPDSMDAPVPASALIHSATLISAGSFIVLLFYNLIVFNLYLLNLLLLLGSLTACYGSITASFQTDLKKLLAYSTISHCGFMFICLSTGNFFLPVLYVYLHGLYKALVFMICGNVIKLLSFQDFRKMGLLFKQVPYDCTFLFFSTLGLSSLPLTFGFYFKHYLLIILLVNFDFLNVFLLISFFFSIVYSLRVIYFVLFSTNKLVKNVYFSRFYSMCLHNNIFNSFVNKLCKLIFLFYTLLLVVVFSYFLVYLFNGVDLFVIYKASLFNFFSTCGYGVDCSFKLDFFFFFNLYNFFFIVFLILFFFLKKNKYFSYFVFGAIFFLIIFFFFFNLNYCFYF